MKNNTCHASGRLTIEWNQLDHGLVERTSPCLPDTLLPEQTHHPPQKVSNEGCWCRGAVHKPVSSPVGSKRLERRNALKSATLSTAPSSSILMIFLITMRRGCPGVAGKVKPMALVI